MEESHGSFLQEFNEGSNDMGCSKPKQDSDLEESTSKADDFSKAESFQYQDEEDIEEEKDLSDGILFLEILEMKERLCLERQELDNLTLECEELEHTRKHMNRLKEMEELRKTKLELKELQLMYHDLDESMDMLSLETELIKNEQLSLTELLTRRNSIKAKKEEARDTLKKQHQDLFGIKKGEIQRLIRIEAAAHPTSKYHSNSQFPPRPK
eukprot:CAMPEP_0178896658 /NCGR_PEP_ID=MMETSP0786-20121207/1303_1 /TAXON_ID=186022 /ORGANISM="Thalassionema frauenfeldii, Strain CCMP 1798" /LENGTH=210 /DNA_ID=CAMNT_0020567101 /DNA_START=187 /DNA_END=817 /DNA_ORIENTATION=-